MSELMWVPVPGGQIVGGRATLRVLVVPRLGGDEAGNRLDQHGMHEWPTVLRTSTLTVETAVSAGEPGTPVDGVVRNDRFDDTLWPRFFAPDMKVRPWQPGNRRTAREDQPIVDVAQTAKHHSAITAVYANSAQRAGEASAIRQQIAEQRRELGESDTTVELAPTPVRDWSGPDFHLAVSLLREHPAVLQALGLVVELSLPADRLPPTAGDGYRLVQVLCQPGQGLVDVQMVSPWTRYHFADQRFVAAPGENGSDVTRGMVDLSRDHWRIATFDVVGGVDRLRDTIRSLDGQPADPAIVPAEQAGTALPPLRSAGLLLMRDGRSGVFDSRMRDATGNAALASMDTAELTADELVLGYRVDVREPGADSVWRPLCRRAARYFVDGEVPVVGDQPVDEESHVKANAATAAGPDERLRADEVVARWDGWSLALRRPDFGQPAVPVRRTGPMPYDFRWEFEPMPGSQLPELRFGSSYQLRVRVADMAGGGLSAGDPIGDRYASSEVTYRRHEPVPPPELPPPPGVLMPDGKVDHDALGPGGTVERLVVRSDPAAGLGPDVFIGPTYPANDRRTLLPPPGSFAMAEQHGVLDGDDERTVGWVHRSTAPPSTPDGGYSWLPDPTCAGVALYVRPEPGAPSPEQRDRQPWSTSGTWPDFAAKTLELLPERPLDGQTVSWEDGVPRAVVRLAPAEQVALELTSYPEPDDIDKFEIKQWLAGGSDDVVRQGRHPMATPPRIVHLVHAVRRPLGVPAGTLTADRSAGETSAVLRPDADPSAVPRLDADPLLGVHPGSTVQVDVSARWDEWRDDSATGTSEAVQSVTVDVAAAALPTLRHRFGDTRHRRVTYTLEALGRFRQYFHPDPDDPDAFTARGELGPVFVRSTARPAPPVVLATAPSFHWVDELAGPGSVHRSRRGRRLRVELARPWNLTGVGEQLAVVVWPAAAADAVPEPDRPFVTRVRRDPIWATPEAAGTVDEHMFLGAEPATVVLAETGHEVVVLPYTPELVGDRWCVDVELQGAAASSYCPFVQLAVGRYQEHSLERLELSQVVRTEPVQLFPDRALHVQDGGDHLVVRLDGLGPVGPPNRVLAVIEHCMLPDGMSTAEVHVTAAGADGVPGVPAWRRLPGHAVEGVLGEALPALPKPPGLGPLRVVVREVEQIASDAPPAADPVAAELTQRTVFVDIVPVTPI